MAVSIPNIRNEIVILTDSASCLLAIESGTSKHPWIQEIEKISQNKSVRFCWVPGHAGISGNTEADRLANEARSQPVIDVALPGEDALRAVKAALRHRWEYQWYNTRDAKLREVKPDTHRWKDCDNAADQRVLTRLRIGHTRLTHSFLLEKKPPTNCECCGTIVDVRHLLLQCRKYEKERQENDISMTSLVEVLGNDENCIRELLKFLKDTCLYTKL